MSKLYFGIKLLYIRLKSFIIIIFLQIFGLKCGIKTQFYKKPIVSGYLNKIRIGNNCSLHEGIRIVVNKEGYLNIGENTLISSNVNINVGTGNISIGSNAMIASNTYIINNDHDVFDNLSVRFSGHITESIIIEDNVWIGANVTILKGVTIGEGAIIGAGSVVTKDILPYSINFGNPCKFIKYRFSKEELMSKLINDKYDNEKIDKLIKEM